MTDWKRKKLWLEQETGQLYTQKYLLLRVTSIIRKIVSNNCPGEKNRKNGISYFKLSDQLFQMTAFTLKIYLRFWTTICNHVVRWFCIKDANQLKKIKLINKINKNFGKFPGEVTWILGIIDVDGVYPNIPHG